MVRLSIWRGSLVKLKLNQDLTLTFNLKTPYYTIKNQKESYHTNNSLIAMNNEKKIYICLGIGLALLMAVIVFFMNKTYFVQHLFGF